MRGTAPILTCAALFLSSLPAASGELRSPEAFSAIADETARSVALFEEMTKVITHPRCMNCHPVDDRPRQGDDMHPHMPPVVRWDDSNFGPPGLHCSSCHSGEEVAFVGSEGSIPGHEPWQLAPLSMGWIGLTHAEICAQLKDTSRNGGRSLADLVHHHATDHLVASAWHVHSPTRTAAPGSQEIFAQLTEAWIETGAVCPED